MEDWVQGQFDDEFAATDRTGRSTAGKRTLPVSFLSPLPPEQQADAEEQVKALIARAPETAKSGDISFPFETSMFADRKASSGPPSGSGLVMLDDP